MSHSPNPTPDPGQPTIYHIRIRGHLGPQWTDWFEGMAIAPEDTGITVMTGPVTDQAALHGLLRKVRDLGLPLVSFAEEESPPQDTPTNDVNLATDRKGTA